MMSHRKDRFFIALISILFSFSCVSDAPENNHRNDAPVVLEEIPRPAMDVSYFGLEPGENLEYQDIEAIDLYLRSELVNSPKVNLSLKEEDKVIYGKVSKIGSKYVIVVNITDFGTQEELASFSEDFLSLHEFGFIVDSIIAKVEGRTLIKEDEIYLASLDLENVERFDFNEIDIDLDRMKNSEIRTLLSEAVPTQAGVERMASILSDRLEDCYALFNQEQYENVIDESQVFISRFEEMTDDYQVDLQGYKQMAHHLMLHSQQRIELIQIKEDLRQFVSLQMNEKQTLDPFYRMASIEDSMFVDWIDQEQALNLREQVRILQNYYLQQYIQGGMEKMESLIMTRDFKAAFELYDQYKIIFDTQSENKIFLQQEETKELLFSGSRYLTTSFLAWGQQEFNQAVDLEDYDKAYEGLDYTLTLLDSHISDEDNYIPDLRDTRAARVDTMAICVKLSQSRFEEFEFNINYYAFDGSADGVRETFYEYSDYLFNSALQYRYVFRFKEILDQYLDTYTLSWDGSRSRYNEEFQKILVVGSIFHDVYLTRDEMSEILQSNKDLFSEEEYHVLVNKLENYIPTGMKFVEGGTYFMQGSGVAVREVVLDDFYIGYTEVTQGKYESVMGVNPSAFRNTDVHNLPVNNVTWRDAVEFCNALSILEGYEPCYTKIDSEEFVQGWGNQIYQCNFEANGYRLPTEAEWEYAARGGNLSEGYKYAGSDIAYDVANYMRSGVTLLRPVATYDPNELGLYDMNGNVAEWCWDWFQGLDSSSQHNPIGPENGDKKVVRGGSANHNQYFYITTREQVSLDTKWKFGGFRVVRNATD